jgi:predicted nucleic acid-binding protein
VTFLDTSVIIDFLTGDERIVSIVEEILKNKEVKTTAITEYELLRYKTKIRKQAAERFLSGAVVYPFDRAAANEAAILYEQLRDSGSMINENDILIAGIALSNHDVLLTRDQKLASIGKENIKMV